MARKRSAMASARVFFFFSSRTSSSAPFLRVAWTRSAVSIVFPPPFARERLDGVGRDELVEDRAAAVLLLPEDAPEPLDVLAHRAAAGDDHRDVGLRDVHTLIQHLRCHNRAIHTFREGGEDL